MQRLRGLVSVADWLPSREVWAAAEAHKRVPAALTPSTFSLYTNTRLPEDCFKVDWVVAG